MLGPQGHCKYIRKYFPIETTFCNIPYSQT